MRIPKYSRGGWLVEGYGSTQAQRPTNQPFFVASLQHVTPYHKREPAYELPGASILFLFFIHLIILFLLLLFSSGAFRKLIGRFTKLKSSCNGKPYREERHNCNDFFQFASGGRDRKSNSGRLEPTAGGDVPPRLIHDFPLRKTVKNVKNVKKT